MTARRVTLAACNLVLLLVLLSILRAEPQGIAAVHLVAADPARLSRLPQTEAPSSPGPVAAKALFRTPRPVVKVALNDQPPLPAPKPSFWLVGVMWGETDRFAIIQPSRNAPIRRVRVGEMVERWRLDCLTARVATFRMDDQSVPLDLQRTRSPGSEPVPNAYGRLGSR